MNNTISKCFCSGCGKYFVGPSYHEMHRTGDASKRQRRCMTTQEMHDAGMDCEKKNVRITIEGKETFQEHDVWFSVIHRESVKSFYQDSQDA